MLMTEDSQHRLEEMLNFFDRIDKHSHKSEELIDSSSNLL